MRSAIRSTILALVLAIGVAAPAAALIPCESCDAPDATRCAGICNGQRVLFCSDWYFLGCHQLQAVPATSQEATLQEATAEEELVSEERFLRSLVVGPAATTDPIAEAEPDRCE